MRAPRRLFQKREGSSAVEFAMVAMPFFFMMFAIMELAFVFVLDSVLENAAIEAGRLVRTGQADKGGITASQFKDRLCSRMSIFSADCASKTSVDVRVLTQFRNVNPPDPMQSGAFKEDGLTYVTGQPGSLVLIRAWYRHTLFTPFLQQGLSRTGNGQAVLTATTAFRNEPYDS